ncbi:MAG: sigma54 specific transcriptional regulator, Fis family [Deltaproteobacteria bacterium]|nr:sigma54 specific transcriptional regulator, Fis family [Deltaproteobacteria bacterium]
MVIHKERLRSRAAFDARVPEALGESKSFLDFREQLSKVAPVNRPVLLIGERGTGKELAASRLHFLSKRWQGPLVALNCSALSPSLIESELFGYEKGAFTGAEERRRGRFESADGGTLFLDEIGNIPIEVQEKILRVVEYGSFERVGSPERVDVDVRIVAATHADLEALVVQGRFKRDLLDRLSFEVLYLPPLRERKEDIALLANHFAVRMAHELDREEMPRFSDEALRALQDYTWPGNVRELKNVVERAVYRSDSSLITAIIFNPFQREGTTAEVLLREVKREVGPESKSPEPRKPLLKKSVENLEVSLLQEALEESRYSQRKAAALLGLTYHQFRGMLRKYKAQLSQKSVLTSGERS